MTRPALRHDLDQLPRYVAGRPPRADGFKLSSNEVAEPPAPEVVTAMAAALGDVNRYPEVTGAALAGRIAADLGVPAQRVVVGGGSIAVLQQLLQAVVEPGRAVVFAWRSYEAYPILARVAHASPVGVPLRAHRHDLEAMAAAVRREAAALVVVCNPNNPTGTTVGTDELTCFLDAVPSDCVVVLDEAYREFVTDPDVPDGVTLAEGRENVVVLRTFSKAHALAGLRVGHAVAPERVAEAIRSVALPFTVSRVAETAASAALDAWPRQSVVVKDICTRRDALVADLNACGLSVPASQANFVWLPEESLRPGFTESLERQGVSVRRFPGDGIRITVGEVEAVRRVVEAASSGTA